MQTDSINEPDRRTVITTTAAALTGGLAAETPINATAYGDVGGTGELRIETA